MRGGHRVGSIRARNLADLTRREPKRGRQRQHTTRADERDLQPINNPARAKGGDQGRVKQRPAKPIKTRRYVCWKRPVIHHADYRWNLSAAGEGAKPRATPAIRL